MEKTIETQTDLEVQDTDISLENQDTDTCLENIGDTEDNKAKTTGKSKKATKLSEHDLKVKELNSLVEIELFKDNKDYSDDVFVAVNGKGWTIQRGVKVQIPKYVADVIYQSLDQNQKTSALIEELSSDN